MSLFDYLKPVETMASPDVKRLLDEKGPDGVNLIDVRQPREYESGHLAGAELIPVAELQDRLRDLDKFKPTVAY